MNNILPVLILLPFLGFLLSLIIPSRNENALSTLAFLVTGLHLGILSVFSVYWLLHGHPHLNIKEVVLYSNEHYEFFIDFFFDKLSLVFLLVGSFLTFLVAYYSRYYLHKESGYKRFFNTILLFFTGYTLTVCSGNLETLFMGWEILGITSFLLIAFYRNRYLPVKNAVKVFSVYRIGDVGLILAMWLSHHLFGENITFLKLERIPAWIESFQTHSLTGTFIALMLLLSAAVKSAQLPFSSWLPRAMEGPTPSSAIFYGSLSVHIGLFLLIRTHHLWEMQYTMRVLVAALGIATAIIANLIARVQSSVKTQIAYSSIAQIGLMFLETALGFHNLALYHFAGNALLRTYQLLISPSVVAYRIREQFFHFEPRKPSLEDSWPKRIEYSLYVLSLKEWNLDTLMYTYYWQPFKQLGNKLGNLNLNRALLLFGLSFIPALISSFYQQNIPVYIHHYLAEIFAGIGLLLVLKAFTERRQTTLAWSLVLMNHTWVALAISFNEKVGAKELILYLSGVAIGGISGWLVLRRMKKLEEGINLDQFHGHIKYHPKLAVLLLLSCLAVSGFPISGTFIGIDLVFGHIHENQAFLATMVSLGFIVSGIALIRVYARVFLGPHLKSPLEMPYRSS